jgi:hypothetical protein
LLIGPVAGLVRVKCHVPLRAFLGSQGLPLGAALAAGGGVWLLREPVEGALGSGLALLTLAGIGFTTYAVLLASVAPERIRALVPSWDRRRS